MFRTAFLICTALALTACGAAFQHPTPKGFVELEDQEERDYDYRAVSPDGMVLSVRALKNEPKGEMSFWTDAIANHMRKRIGYALLSKKEVTTTSGLKGTQLRFGHDRGKTPHLYYVTVFATDERIFVLEAGGTKEQVEAREEAIQASAAGFRVN